MSKKALFIIDVQKGFMNAHTLHLPAAVTALQRNPYYDTVLASRFINSAESPYIRWLGWERMQSGEETSLAFRPVNHAFIIDKGVYNSMNPVIFKMFEDSRIEEVHLCGLDTNMCVLITACAIFDDGRFRPYVLADACASHSGQEYHDCGLKLLEKAIGRKQIILSSIYSS